MRVAAEASRVVVVEDNDDSREMLCRLLRRKGFDVAAFPDAEAVDAMIACNARFTLLDVRLPGRSGDDLGRELAQRCPDTQIIFLTGEAAVHTLKAAVPSSLVLRKPIDTAVLYRLLGAASTRGWIWEVKSLAGAADGCRRVARTRARVFTGGRPVVGEGRSLSLHPRLSPASTMRTAGGVVSRP